MGGEDIHHYNNYEEVYEDLKDLTFNNLCEGIKKFYRDGKPLDINSFDEHFRTLSYYIGDVCKSLGFNINTILRQNYDKLIKRRETGTLQGDGDNREEAKSA